MLTNDKELVQSVWKPIKALPCVSLKAAGVLMNTDTSRSFFMQKVKEKITSFGQPTLRDFLCTCCLIFPAKMSSLRDFHVKLSCCKIRGVSCFLLRGSFCMLFICK